MHLLIANRWYPPHSGYGGVAVYNQYLARALVALGHRVTVIAARYSSEVPFAASDDGVTVCRLLNLDQPRLRRLPLAGRYYRPAAQLTYSARVARLIHQIDRQTPVDVVEFAEVEAEGFAYLRGAHRPTVVRCHTPTFVLRDYYTSREMTYDTQLTSMLERDAIRRADRLTAPSRDMARTITARCPLTGAGDEGGIAVIPNALDVGQFSVARYRQPDGRASVDGEVTILHVGRLDRTKGIEVLARAIPEVARRAPTARFVYVGDDRPDGQGSTWCRRLGQMVDAAGVGERVEFVGAVDHTNLLDWYSRADIVVVPSILYESFSYTCAQAMASRLPVVASRIGGIPETVDHGVTGLLVEPGNVAALASAVVTLARDSELRRRMGEAGQTKAQSCFAAKVVARQMLSIYESVQAQCQAQ